MAANPRQARYPRAVKRNAKATAMSGAEDSRKWFWLVYLAATAVICGLRYHQYTELSSTIWVPMARAAAAGIYLNFALLLLPMLRLSLSWQRLGWLRRVMPLNKAVQAHVIAGNAVVLFSALHVGAYIGMFVTKHLRMEQLEVWATPFTGLLLTLCLTTLAIAAWARARWPFEVFFYTHFLAGPIFALAVMHAHLFFGLMLVPGILYGIDRVLRLLWATQSAQVEEVTVQGRDVALAVHRPVQFRYHAGDYAFLCIPSISSTQWHPFSLINAPDAAGSLQFRIRRCGSWTHALATLAPGATVYIDGPFASPCRDLHDCRRAIIIAAGIGITPFASFLADVRANCLPNEHGPQEPPPFERLHLIWLERDQASQEGFYPLIAELHHALGGALTAQLVVDKAPEGPCKPLVSVGRLDWTTELNKLQAQMPGATVFFCGPKPLSDIVKAGCRAAGLAFVTESF